MSASFLIDPGQHAVFSRASGVFTYEDARGHMDRLLADARFRPDMRQVIDFGDITKVTLTGDQIRELANRKIFGPGSSRAFVAPDDVLYGLARMFQAHRESNGETGIAIFRGMEEAVSWIGLPADLVDRAFAQLRKAVAEA